VLSGGGLCFQWARECTNCIVAGDLFMENSLVEVKAKIEAYNVKLEQIEVKRIKNFDHFLNKGFSLDEAYSKAATITHEEYGEASKSIPETLSELVKLKGDVMDATLKKQPIQRFLESYELKATADFSIKAKK